MNFYKHHIGDYDQATRHLSFIEDASYCRLLRKYFAEEKPLSTDRATIKKLVGARTKDEKAAVDAVLEEFFVLEDDGWHNKRADEELSKARAQAEANRKVALEREAKRRAKEPQTDHDKSTNRVQDESTIRVNEQHDSYSVDKHESLPSREPSQTPDSRSKPTDESNVGGTRMPSPEIEPTRAGSLCLRLRKLGVDAAPHLLQHPDWIAMLAVRTDDDLIAVAEIARAKKPGTRISLNYLLPMLRDQDPASLTGGPRHAARQGTVAATVQAFTGSADPDSGDGGGYEEIIEGSATRVP